MNSFYGIDIENLPKKSERRFWRFMEWATFISVMINSIFVIIICILI